MSIDVDKIKAQLKTLEENPDTALVTAAYRSLDLPGEPCCGVIARHRKYNAFLIDGARHQALKWCDDDGDHIPTSKYLESEAIRTLSYPARYAAGFAARTIELDLPDPGDLYIHPQPAARERFLFPGTEAEIGFASTFIW